VNTLVKDAIPGLGITDDPAGLDMFLQPECAAAIWRRQMPPEMETWLSRLDPGVLPKGRVILPPDAVADTLGHLFDMSGLPEGPVRDWLLRDMAALADMFADLMSARYLRLRLDVVTNNACRKFHVDAIKARLLCTYRGTGTQYGVAVGGTDPKRVFTVPTGAVILLRGSLWPTQPPCGLLHRSPPIAGTGETRLVLVLDPVEEPYEEV